MKLARNLRETCAKLLPALLLFYALILILFVLTKTASAQYIGTGSDRYITGNVTSTQSITINTQGGSTLTLNVTGTWTGTLTPEVSVDGTNWVSATITPVFPVTTAVSTITANGQWQVQSGGLNQFRLRGNTVASGTAVVFEECGIGAANVTNVSATITGTIAATQSGTWTVQPGNTPNTTAWKVDGSAVTQPISAASLPLPTGAALDTSVNGILGLLLAQSSNTSGQTGPLVQGSVKTAAPTYTTDKTAPLSLTTAGALRVDNSAVTQPISASSLPLPAGAATSALQPGFGTPGTASSNVVTVQGIASMTKLLVTPDSIALPANQSVNVSQINAVTPLMGNGTTGTGSPRVTIASDNTAFSTNSIQSGTWTVQIGNTANTTPILNTPTPATSGGTTIAKLLSASGTNATSTKGSAGQVYQYQFSNTNAAWRYVHFYNKASSPSVGSDVPNFTVGVPPGGCVGAGDIMGMVFGTGIAYSVTTGSADTDSGSAGVGDIVGQFTYK